jgi:hypothetical protein
MSNCKVYLSRRNLLTLLSKLDRKAAGDETACAIIKYQNQDDEFQQTMGDIMVIAISDEEAYSTRSAGEMHPADEAKLTTLGN